MGRYCKKNDIPFHFSPSLTGGERNKALTIRKVPVNLFVQKPVLVITPR